MTTLINRIVLLSCDKGRPNCKLHADCTRIYFLQNPTRAYLGAAADLGCSSSRTDFRDKDRLQLSDSIEPVETWIFIGEPSRKHPPIYCKRYFLVVLE